MKKIQEGKALLCLMFYLFTLVVNTASVEHTNVHVSRTHRHKDNPYIAALHAHTWQSDHGYVEVGKGAFMFWWLYYADGEVKESSQKPLVIWIQGGPGLAATGIANFCEIGPFNMDMKPRNHTWVNGRNLLLIDHPVGTGFSYVTDDQLYTTTDRQVVVDLIQLVKGFLKVHPEFRKTASYIFSQSYGGKIAPWLGYRLHRAIRNKHIKMNLKAVGIGSGWVDPKESSLMYPHYLYNMGMIDSYTYLKCTNITNQIASTINKMAFVLASRMNIQLFSTLVEAAGFDINFNNMNRKGNDEELKKLSHKVNQFVKPTLAHIVNQSLIWKYDAEEVFTKLSKNFMKPSTRYIEKLLNESNINIAIYNGNLDATTPMAGAVNWVHKLRWFGAEEFKNKRRTRLAGKWNGFYKVTDRLSFWWVLRAGHWVPEDNPEAMEQILKYIIN